MSTIVSFILGNVARGRNPIWLVPEGSRFSIPSGYGGHVLILYVYIYECVIVLPDYTFVT